MLRKYQRVEDYQALSESQHAIVQQELRKTGNTSMTQATEQERAQVTEALDSSNNPK